MGVVLSGVPMEGIIRGLVYIPIPGHAHKCSHQVFAPGGSLFFVMTIRSRVGAA